ncbi:MAG: outer membrane lipoprotein-sorting protein [Gammaproteobacteria bacterium]|nr:outer membrane lipoprotein-sorting protein [Gammaproteobacteria bacterium]
MTCFLAVSLAHAADPSAAQVMKQVDERYQGDTRKQKGILTLIDKSKNKRVREVHEWMKKFGSDEKVFTRVISPSEVSGTTILSYEWQQRSKDDETWLYLPELRKVKRLATTDKSSYFLGSDFTYSDLSGIDVDDFTYRFDAENAKMASQGTWVIMAEPVQDRLSQVLDETGYTKIKYWIDQEKKVIVKAKYWLKDGGKIKYFTASDLVLKDKVWVTTKAQMVMTQGGHLQHASIFEIKDVVFNSSIKDEIFTTYAMERQIN